MAEHREQSEFNYAVSFLNRINFLFWECGNCSREMNAHGWFSALATIRREMSDDMSDTELIASNVFMNDINAKVNQPRPRNQALSGMQEISSDLYNNLDSFEIFLRKIIKKAGYKTKVKDDPRFAQ